MVWRTGGAFGVRTGITNGSRLTTAGEAQHGDPLAFARLTPDNLAVERSRNLARRQIAMKIKIPGVELLIPAP